MLGATIKRGVVFLLTCCLGLFLVGCCACGSWARPQAEYDRICAAATFSAEKIRAEFHGNIPLDFDAKRYLEMVRAISEENYDTLSKYDLKVTPVGRHFLLEVRDPDSGKLLVFDYSCKTRCEGNLALTPDADMSANPCSKP